MKVKQRENNYDLLRVFACLAIIFLHVTAVFTTSLVDKGSFYHQLSYNHQSAIFVINILTRFAVPIFMMLSGAFLIANKENKNRKKFYEKSFQTLFIPTMQFSIFYFLFLTGKTVLKNIVGGGSFNLAVLLEPLLSFICGKPYYHLWYMFTLFGLYLLIPEIIRLVEKIDKQKKSGIIYSILIIYCIASGLTGRAELSYGINKIAPYIGYLLLGYKLKQVIKDKKNNALGLLFIVLGIGFEIILSPFVLKNYNLIYTNQANLLIPQKLLFSIDNFGPFIFLSSIFIFIGFALLKVNINFGPLSKATFVIYLIHAFFVDIIKAIIFKYKLYSYNIIILIIISSIIVFLLSWIVAFVYEKLRRRFHKKS